MLVKASWQLGVWHEIYMQYLLYDSLHRAVHISLFLADRGGGRGFCSNETISIGWYDADRGDTNWF